MSKTGSIILRVLGAIVLVAIIASAAGYAGFALGTAHNAEIVSQAEDLQQGAESYGRGFGDGYAMHPMMWGGFGLMAIGRLFGFLFFLFIVGGLIRLVFFPRPWGWHRWYAHQGWNSQTPPWAQHGCGPQDPTTQAPAAPGETKPESK
ncbi:MAG TPA: hypothetical protein VN376_04520 [Longilinea sp.]|nr:hypothetical protein [Longilinea sp.]